MKAIIAYADKETHEAARRAAFERNLSLSEWTVEAVKKALGDAAKSLRGARRKG